MLLLSWNVAGRVTRLPAQIEEVVAFGADLVCLQEVTPATKDAWQDALGADGYHPVASEWAVAPSGSRRYGVLIAARTQARPVAVPGLPWPERHLAVDLDGLEVHTLHAPTSFKEELVKVRTLEALHAALLAGPERPTVLAGDLNTPRYESREGAVTSFARTSSGKLRPHLGERHDRAELALIADLPARGWSDAFRAIHGYARRDRSWRAGRGYGYRLDHVLLSPSLEPLSCDYIHSWREGGLSDHSAVWSRFAHRGHVPSTASPLVAT